jgi:hypothetical protein
LKTQRLRGATLTRGQTSGKSKKVKYICGACKSRFVEKSLLCFLTPF